MKKSSKWLGTTLSAVLIASLLSPAYGSAAVQADRSGMTAKDLTGHWAQASVQKWLSSGLIQGYPDHTFSPNAEITRAEFVSLLNHLFGFTAQSKEDYTDVPADSWFESAFSIAREAGYYTGYPGNAAKPAESLTRQDAAVLLARAFEISENDTAPTLFFPDQENIGVYAREAVRALSGYFQGYPNGTFRPEEPITRAEIVTLIDKLVSAYYPAAGTFTAGKIQGSAVVNHGGVVLKDAVIQGNLYLAPGIGDGEVTLDHVTVQGTTFIEGGGAHTVIVKDSDLGSVLVNRRDGQVHVQLSGTTHIEQLTANSPSQLDAGDSSIIDSAEFNQPVQLSLGAGASIASLEPRRRCLHRFPEREPVGRRHRNHRHGQHQAGGDPRQRHHAERQGASVWNDQHLRWSSQCKPCAFRKHGRRRQLSGQHRRRFQFRRERKRQRRWQWRRSGGKRHDRQPDGCSGNRPHQIAVCLFEPAPRQEHPVRPAACHDRRNVHHG
ncbi:S-layer homology domain-containing protein [Paenibacillus sp. AR247]|uniref:S-layer homology domain-containing protein n=1 Tax=Paenibacillus sp. AR247 TaxID=1631599 RepID=UPI000CF917D3|nr:S-layer homology domain-containing protein [Paenibacillus sp. AR247]PQP88135.1 hypothetical protein CPT76_19780 [Paenibacillus sp. AR247]